MADKPAPRILAPVVKVMAYMAVTCETCGKGYEAMGRASVTNGVVSKLGEVGDVRSCPHCREADHKAQREAYDRKRRQQAWVRKAQQRGGK